MASYEDFLSLDIRVGEIIDAAPFPEANKPAYKLTIDFGDAVGVKRSSAQLTAHYTPRTLIGRRILGVVNFPARQIGPFLSEALTLGVPDASGECVLISPDEAVPLGGRLY